MEQIYKRTIPSRRQDKHGKHQCSVLAYSNAVSTVAGKLSELSKEARKFLKLDKEKALDWD